MSMKILGGRYKGFVINPGKSFKDRPTSVMLRRKLFDSNQHLDSTVFVDICAGSGMMGLEALSRNAKKVYFIDINKRYLKSIQDFCADKNIQGDYKLENKDAVSFLKSLESETDDFTDWMFFVDPPYEHKEVYLKVFNQIKTLPGKKILFLEGCRQKNFTYLDLEQHFGSYDKIFEQGTNYIAVYKL